MKKIFDKYIAQSSKTQIVVLAMAFLSLIVVGGVIGRAVASRDNDDNVVAFGRPEAWGFLQCVDGGFVQATIGNNTNVEDGKVVEPAPIAVILLSLGFWLCGMVFVSFFTGVATDFLNSRRERILAGGIDYSFRSKYALIVGYDFQVKNLIHGLLEESPSRDVVLVTDSTVEDIYADLLPELSSQCARRLFILRKDIAAHDAYECFTVTGAEQIYLIGDGDAVGRDGKTLQALEAIALKAGSELQSKSGPEKPIKVYMHIEDPVLYSQVRTMRLPADEGAGNAKATAFDLEVYNYFESWAWECWAHKDAKDGDDLYLPLRHRPAGKHVELFVIGAGSMGRAMVNFAMPLLNYGEDGKHCKITVFDPNGLKKGFLPDCATLDSLPETIVEFREMDGCSDDANDIMLAAAMKPDTSVTVVIALSDPGAALRAYSGLSNRLRRENVSVLVWQAAPSKNCPRREYLKMGGPGDEQHPNLADKTTIRYFGMTDRLPWKNPDRFNCGMAVNYFYNAWFPYSDQPKPYPPSPKATEPDFKSVAKALWNSKKNLSEAELLWRKMPRWKKWASVNSGDSFREKATLFAGTSYAEAAERLLKAEHNRWWTEKLLGGWIPVAASSAGDESHADKERMIHGDMVPFEQLSDGVKDKDKINIAAMAAFNFI